MDSPGKWSALMVSGSIRTWAGATGQPKWIVKLIPPRPWLFIVPECPGSGLFPDPYDCHSYINCVFDNAWLLECPSDYLFDPISLTCKPPGQVTCTEISGEPTVRPTEPTFTVQPGYVCEEDGLFPYEPSCHYYYQCANTIPYLRPCSANLIFDPKKKRCVTVAEADLESLTCELNPTLDRISSRLLIALKKSFVRGVRIRPEIRKPSSETSRIAANHAGPQTPKRNH
ncbi:unnamed protein product [Notodromas monacha]|uniref:Chitin-binding type-2 domain-containing protein n=1 Tax=Notodromas monacha TaxID=399045 RepID=A0A7R9BGD6_9CRUS|nr:unnamed protein product [Notodromas monacha]CAG0914792.1 unnamed protein product [Notodromas monacha]